MDRDQPEEETRYGLNLELNFIDKFNNDLQSVNQIVMQVEYPWLTQEPW